MCRSEEKSSSVFFAFYIPPDTIDANGVKIVVRIMVTMPEKADDGSDDVMKMEVGTR